MAATGLCESKTVTNSRRSSFIYIYQLVGLSEKYNKLFNNVSLQVIAIMQRDLFNTDRTKSKELVNITEMPEI